MVEVEGVAFHIVAGGEIIQRHDDAIDRTEPSGGGCELEPIFQESIPALALEVRFVLMADEPEQDLNGIVIPGRSRTHSNLTQRPECVTLVTLFVVFVL